MPGIGKRWIKHKGGSPGGRREEQRKPVVRLVVETQGQRQKCRSHEIGNYRTVVGEIETGSKLRPEVHQACVIHLAFRTLTKLSVELQFIFVFPPGLTLRIDDTETAIDYRFKVEVVFTILPEIASQSGRRQGTFAPGSPIDQGNLVKGER